MLSTRRQLLLHLVTLSTALSLGIGVTAWWWLEAGLRARARESAAAIAGMLAVGGFSLNDTVLSRMRALTGYAFEIDPVGPDPDGSVTVQDEGRRVRVSYHTPAFWQARRQVLLAVLGSVAMGSLAATVLAWWLAGRQAGPLERLAAAAQRLGAGDWDRPIAAPAATAEVAMLAGDMEQMRQRLRELDAANRRAERLATLGTFTATIAHEVRNPLSAVQLSLQMLARRFTDDPDLALIRDELERLDLIVDELVAYSRGIDASLQDCELAAIVRDVCRLLARQAQHAGVALQHQGEALVRADPRRIRQLLLNLVLNAIQAQHGDGSVSIRVLPDGLEVSDRGPGIPEAMRGRLFQAFAGERSGGGGLGLHLARGIAQAHGAVLDLVPSEQGSCFQLRGLAHGGERE